MDEDDAFLYGTGEEPADVSIANGDITQPISAHANGADSGEDMDEATDESDVEIILDADPSAPVKPPVQDFRRGPHRTWGAPQISSGNLQQQIAAQQSQLQQEATFPLLPPSNAQSLRTIPFSLSADSPIQFNDAEPQQDLSTPALVDDQTSLLDIDIDSLESKPWTLPGAHTADYFNYGFTEHTWKLYSAKQKQSREEADKIAESPFSSFGQVSVQEAWVALPPELKGVMMQTIMASFGGAGAGGGPPGGGMMPFGGMPQMGMMEMPTGAGQDMSQQYGQEEGSYDQAEEYGEHNGYNMQDFDPQNQNAFGFPSARGRGKRNAFGNAGGGRGNNPFGMGVNATKPVVRQASESSTPLPTGPRHVSPLPANIPTGPRKAAAAAVPIPEGPRASRGKASAASGGYYRDKDASGTASNAGDGLDYGGEAASGDRKDGKRRRRSGRRKDYSSESEGTEYRRTRRSPSYGEGGKSRSRSRSYSPHSKRRAEDDKDSSRGSKSKKSRKEYD